MNGRNSRASRDRRLDGVPIRVTSLAEAIAETLDGLVDPRVEAEAIRFVNAFSLAQASSHSEYHQLLSSSGQNFPDGLPLARWLSIKTGGLAEQVRGPSFFAKMMDEGRKAGIKHYLLGGDEATLEALAENIERTAPGVQIVGSLSPPFRAPSEVELAERDRMIRASGADIVWVGLGTPKQDFEAQRIVNEVGVSAAGVGAAFDFVAGTKAEAPDWMRRAGVEWLFRLASEPRRLWRRYLFGNVRFLWLIAKDGWSAR